MIRFDVTGGVFVLEYRVSNENMGQSKNKSCKFSNTIYGTKSRYILAYAL